MEGKMQYIILDFEWNQPVSKQKMVRSPFKLRGEIIQIGAVKVDENMWTIDTFDIMIRPKHYLKMNKKVQELTDITDANLLCGIPFEEAISQFRKWCGSEFVFLTWGPEDVYMLEDNLMLYNMDTSWIPKAYDAQVIFDDQVTMENRDFSLGYAMYKFGIKPLKCHDALNDAINTVKVLMNLDFRSSFDVACY